MNVLLEDYIISCAVYLPITYKALDNDDDCSSSSGQCCFGSHWFSLLDNCPYSHIWLPTECLVNSTNVWRKIIVTTLAILWTSLISQDYRTLLIDIQEFERLISYLFYFIVTIYCLYCIYRFGWSVFSTSPRSITFPASCIAYSLYQCQEALTSKRESDVMKHISGPN